MMMTIRELAGKFCGTDFGRVLDEIILSTGGDRRAAEAQINKQYLNVIWCNFYVKDVKVWIKWVEGASTFRLYLKTPPP